MDFKQLLEQSRQLTTHIVTPHAPLERGLEHIEAQTRRLLSRTRSDHVKKDRASYLLANRGFDAEKVSETLNRINLALSFEPLDSIPDTDINGYLRNDHENIVSAAIEEQKKQTILDFEKRFENAVHSDWQNVKRRIMDHQPNDSIKSPVDAELLSGNPRLTAYTRVVSAINDSRISLKPFNALKAFSTASEVSAKDSQQQFISRCWDLLSQVLGLWQDKIDAVDPGYFTSAYSKLYQTKASEESTRFKMRLVTGARSWLQESFRLWMSDHVRSQRYEIGGMPSIHSEIEAFLKIKFMRNNRWSLPWLDLSIGKAPFWAHLYTLVRMGLIEDALEYIEKHSHDLSVSRDRNFRTYFSSWARSEDGILPKNIRDRLLGEWNSSIRDYLADSKSPPKGDVFKYALFKIIGKCELQIKSIRNPDVIATTDDYLWLQMMLMNEDATKIDDIERYSLADFSKKMQKLGLAHFKTTTVWFMVLLLCGEFELAVFELSKDPYFTHDAMHFAIALAYYGVLRVPDNPKSLPAAGTLISSTQIMLEGNSHTINYFHFARMIAKFVKRWIESMPSEALHYLYMIGLYGATDNPKSPTLNKSGVSSTGSEYRKFSYSLIREILVDYRNFGQLLGQLKADGGGRIPGHIEIYRSLIQLSSEQEFLNLVVFPSAQDAENESRFSDAIQLYHLGGDFNRVLELLIRKLGETLLQHTMEDFAEKAVGQVQSTQKGLPLIDSDPVESAEQVLKFYMSHQQYASLIEPQTSSTCQTLIQLYQCRAQLARGIDESGLNIFYGLGIIPDSTDMGEIQRKAESFNELDESIARVIPQMMVLVSQSLYKLYRSLLEKSGLFQVSKESRLQKIRERSRVLLMFAGQVQYRIPSDVFAKMNRVDVMMG